ncbi:DUF167 domain-containing protein [Brevundimonas sp.]|uniref:DUF167 domain-containing protein n=1 Tax=Brevundimonas sp. TaxID=1871086 RepID=UPI001D2A2A34|nr:DUF167 domain-containing protein [Brevundimonas sp.]MBL0948007.1 DUF167 domain-containing protein [Brevundimonas sp.]
MRARLSVRLTPGAAQDQVEGWGTDPNGRPVLKVRVRARPIEGKANEALVRLVADTLGLPRSAVSLVHGDRGRIKRLQITGLREAEVHARLTAL